MHILNIVNVSALHIISALAPFSHFITENQNSLKIEASLRPTDCQKKATDDCRIWYILEFEHFKIITIHISEAVFCSIHKWDNSKNILFVMGSFLKCNAYLNCLLASFPPLLYQPS